MCIVHLLVLKNSSHPTIRTTSSCECSSVVLLSWCGSPPRELFLAYKARSARGATLTFESVAFEPPRAQELRPGKYKSSRNYSLTHYSFRVITKKKEFSKLSDWGKFTKLWDLQRTKLDRSDRDPTKVFCVSFNFIADFGQFKLI